MGNGWIESERARFLSTPSSSFTASENVRFNATRSAWMLTFFLEGRSIIHKGCCERPLRIIPVRWYFEIRILEFYGEVVR